MITGSQHPIRFILEYSSGNFKQHIQAVLFQAFNRRYILPMGVFSGSCPECYPESPFTYIVIFKLVLELPPSHMPAVKFKIKVSGSEAEHRVGVGLQAQKLDKSIAADMEILA